MAHTESDTPVVAVIGGSRGIGLAIGRCLLRDGWRVRWPISIRPKRTDRRTSPALETRSHYIRADIADSASVDRLAAEVQALGGPVRGLVMPPATTGTRR